MGPRARSRESARYFYLYTSISLTLAVRAKSLLKTRTEFSGSSAVSEWHSAPWRGSYKVARAFLERRAEIFFETRHVQVKLSKKFVIRDVIIQHVGLPRAAYRILCAIASVPSPFPPPPPPPIACRQTLHMLNSIRA